MRSASFLAVLFLSAFFVVFESPSVHAQSRTNSSGTGGIHEIRGKVYLPSGRTLDTPIEVELQSISNFSNLKLFTDRDGGYSFRNLAPGNYSIVVTAPEQFEPAREYVTIDTEAQGRGVVVVAPIPKLFTVPIYLRFKQGVVLRNEVINAKWSKVPKAALDHFKRGVDLIQEKKNAEGEAELRKAVEIAPTFAPAHTELGKLALKNGQPEATVESCKTAVRYDDSDFDAHLNM